MILRNARLRGDARLADITIEGGAVTSIAPSEGAAPDLVSAHAHGTPSKPGSALDFVSSNPAWNRGLDGWTVTEGELANFIVLDAATEKDAVRFDADVLYSVRRGREVFRRTPATLTWS